MKKVLSLTAIIFILHNTGFSQENKNPGKIQVPEVVKSAFYKKYTDTKNVTWENENGNYEANWGGKSGEDNSVQLTPRGKFVEIVKAMPVNELPQAIPAYVSHHYRKSKITGAGKVTDAQGKTFYEAEINGKDVIFDEQGNFVKSEK